MRNSPTFQEEAALLAQGHRRVAGIDEVGRGTLAGPVMAAAVVFPVPERSPWVRNIRDSKQLSARQREALYPLICSTATDMGLGSCSPQEIDKMGILEATRRAMMRAIGNLKARPDYLLIDAVRLPECPLPQKPMIRGDENCLSIAAASIVAKVTRDRLMAQMDQIFPGYGFSLHKGYGTSAHMEALRRLGPCPLHRRTFAPVKYHWPKG